MRVSLFEALSNLPDSRLGGSQPGGIANRGANARELTDHRMELGAAVANPTSGVRFRGSILELIRRSLGLFLKVRCMTLRVGVGGTSLQNKVNEHFRFRGERLSRP